MGKRLKEPPEDSILEIRPENLIVGASSYSPALFGLWHGLLSGRPHSFTALNCFHVSGLFAID